MSNSGKSEKLKASPPACEKMRCGKGDMESAESPIESVESCPCFFAACLTVHQKNSLEAAVSSREASPTREGSIAAFAELNHFSEVIAAACWLANMRMVCSTVDSTPKIRCVSVKVKAKLGICRVWVGSGCCIGWTGGARNGRAAMLIR